MDSEKFLYKLVVASDSHHNLANLERILPIINAANYFVFCGDGVDDVMLMRGRITVPVLCVRGNNDFNATIAETNTATLGSTHVLVTHGHRFDVRNGLKPLFMTAQTKKCRLVFYGHTHEFLDKTVQEVHFINPGALFNGSYALVAGDGVDFECKHCSL